MNHLNYGIFLNVCFVPKVDGGEDIGEFNVLLILIFSVYTKYYAKYYDGGVFSCMYKI